ncbi:MAG: efflux RND transporter periplasmic adaptor subunit [Acidobacteriota bacterium]
MIAVIQTARCRILVGGLLAAVCLSCGPSESESIPESQSPVAAPSAGDRVAALGRVEPAEGFIEIASGSPDRVSSVSVREGDWVEAGAVLVMLESREERQRAVDLAQTLLSEARRTHERESDLARAQLKEAEAGLDQARRLRPLETQTRRSDVERLELELADARTNRKRFDELASRDSVSRSEQERYELAFQQKEKALEVAVARLHEAEEREVVETRQAERHVETAKAALERALASGNLSGLEKRLELATAQLDQSIIRAPSSGEVLKIYTRPGEAAAGGPLLLLGDTKALVVVAEVDEDDIGRVRQGQHAVVTSRALPGRLTGLVEAVGHLIARNRLRDLDPAARIDRRVVEVRIRLEDPKAARRLLNLEVDVEIATTPDSLTSGKNRCASLSS